MDKYDSLGNIISYDVKEVSLDGYISKITGSVKDGFIITNTNMQRIPIPVIKKWVGGTKDAVFVKLLADNKEKKTAVLKADAKWKYTFIDLPKYDEKDGHAIIYKVVEKRLPVMIQTFPVMQKMALPLQTLVKARFPFL